MKKIFITFILFFIGATSYAVDTLEWADVAPSRYRDVEYMEDNTFAAKHPYLTDVAAFSIVGLPFAVTTVAKSNGISENNYWYRRKLKFEKELRMCNQIKDNDKRMNAILELKHNEQRMNYARVQIQLQEEEIRAIRNSCNCKHK